MEKAKFYLDEIKKLNIHIKTKISEEEKEMIFAMIENMSINNDLKIIISILIYAVVNNKTNDFDYAMEQIIENYID